MRHSPRSNHQQTKRHDQRRGTCSDDRKREWTVIGHPVLAALSRNERRQMLAREEMARRSGEWGPWDAIHVTPPETDGWLRDVSIAHRNNCFCVLQRNLPNGVTHFAISSLTQTRPTWWEMQRIKDDLAGNSATGVEVYPPHDQIVDGADMYHLWILPDGLEFSLSYLNHGRI